MTAGKLARFQDALGTVLGKVKGDGRSRRP